MTAIALAAAFVAAGPAAAPLFNFMFTEGTSPQARQGFRAAAALWSNLLHDNVTVDLTAGFHPLAPGLLGTPRSARQPYPYATFRRALADDLTSFDDALAIGSLPRGDSFDMLLGFTSNSPHGAGSGIPYLDDGDANNTGARVTTAQARAVGLKPADQALAGCSGACDAFIGFDSQFAFDFDAHDGIGENSPGFAGMAAHEYWREDSHFGLIDPTADPGEALAISQHDPLALDAIGWDIWPMPEPSTRVMPAAGMLQPGSPASRSVARNGKTFRKNKNDG
ncbi:hypothetical protein GCM10007386_57990 [Pseudoduganella dura]|nr:hypothetical protein GCM10007386_57990 [Pseudoduganella dura]